MERYFIHSFLELFASRALAWVFAKLGVRFLSTHIGFGLRIFSQTNSPHLRHLLLSGWKNTWFGLRLRLRFIVPCLPHVARPALTLTPESLQLNFHLDRFIFYLLDLSAHPLVLSDISYNHQDSHTNCQQQNCQPNRKPQNVVFYSKLFLTITFFVGLQPAALRHELLWALPFVEELEVLPIDQLCLLLVSLFVSND